jgi:hypothetical protein
MSGTLTRGFDTVVQLTERSINTGLEMMPGPTASPPGPFPMIARRLVPLNLPGALPDVPYDTVLELERPRVLFDPATGRVTLTCDLGPSSQLTLIQPPPPGVAGVAALSQQLPLDGSVQFNCPLGVAQATTAWPDTPVTGRAAVARLTDAAATTTFNVPQLTLGALVLGGTPVALTVADLQAALAARFTNLRALIGDLPLTTPLPLHDGPTPVRRLQDVQARILAPTAGARPALAVGVISEASHAAGVVPNLAGITQAADLIDGQALIANLWLVRLICDVIKESPGFGGVSFEITDNPPTGRFEGSANVNPPEGDSFTLKEMVVELTTDGVRLSGRGEASGFCWDADFDFSGVLAFTCDPNTGQLSAGLAQPLVINADSDIPWYCWVVAAAIVGILVGALTFWVVGVIAAMIVAFILDTMDLALPNLASIASLPGLFNGIGLPLPTPVASPALIIDTCEFDDLSVRGRPLYVDLAPRQASGDELVRPHSGFDLDAGTTFSVALGLPGHVDLTWTGNTIEAVNGSRLEVVGQSFQTLTYSDLQGLTYPAASIAAAQLPSFMLPWSWTPWHDPIFLGAPLVFGARTSDARYAKCAAWRERSGARLFLMFETYAAPSLALSLEVFIDVTSNTIVDQGEERCVRDHVWPLLPPGIRELQRRYGGLDLLPGQDRALPAAAHGTAEGEMMTRHQRARGPGDAANIDLLLPTRADWYYGPRKCPGDQIVHADETVFWVRVERAQNVTIRALPRMFDSPVTFSWTVLGTAMPPGAATIDVNGVSVTYDDASPYLRLTAPQGVDVVGQVCVVATDASGRRCRACVALNQPGVVRLGGCRPCPKPTRLGDFYRQWACTSRTTQGALRAARRLRTLTAQVEPAPVAPVAVRDAMRDALRASSKGGQPRPPARRRPTRR